MYRARGTAPALNPYAAHFGKTDFGSSHPPGDHAQRPPQNLHAKQGILVAGGFEGSPLQTERAGVLASPHLEEGIVIVQ